MCIRDRCDLPELLPSVGTIHSCRFIEADRNLLQCRQEDQHGRTELPYRQNDQSPDCCSGITQPCYRLFHSEHHQKFIYKSVYRKQDVYKRQPGSPAPRVPVHVYRYLRSRVFPARFHTRTSCYPGRFSLRSTLFPTRFFVGKILFPVSVCESHPAGHASAHHIFYCSFFVPRPMHLPDIFLSLIHISFPTKRPTITASAALYNCWKKVPNKIGKKNRSSCCQMTPVTILFSFPIAFSVCFCVFFVFSSI